MILTQQHVTSHFESGSDAKTEVETAVFRLGRWFETHSRMAIPVLTRVAVSIGLAAGFSVSARADLQPRLGGAAVYDTDLNITWLTNANLAATNMFGTAGISADGRMSWGAA